MMDRGDPPALVLVDCRPVGIQVLQAADLGSERRKDGGQFEPFLQDLSPCQLHSHSHSREVAEPRDLGGKGHSASERASFMQGFRARGRRHPQGPPR